MAVSDSFFTTAFTGGDSLLPPGVDPGLTTAENIRRAKAKTAKLVVQQQRSVHRRQERQQAADRDYEARLTATIRAYQKAVRRHRWKKRGKLMLKVFFPFMIPFVKSMRTPAPPTPGRPRTPPPPSRVKLEGGGEGKGVESPTNEHQAAARQAPEHTASPRPTSPLMAKKAQEKGKARRKPKSRRSMVAAARRGDGITGDEPDEYKPLAWKLQGKHGHRAIYSLPGGPASHNAWCNQHGFAFIYTCAGLTNHCVIHKLTSRVTCWIVLCVADQLARIHLKCSLCRHHFGN